METSLGKAVLAASIAVFSGLSSATSVRWMASRCTIGMLAVESLPAGGRVARFFAGTWFSFALAVVVLGGLFPALTGEITVVLFCSETSAGDFAPVPPLSLDSLDSLPAPPVEFVP